MPKMSSSDTTFHIAPDLIYILQNLAPAHPLIKLVNGHKEAFRDLEEIFRKKTLPEYL